MNKTRTFWPYLVVVGLLAVICAMIFISRRQDRLAPDESKMIENLRTGDARGITEMMRSIKPSLQVLSAAARNQIELAVLHHMESDNSGKVVSALYAVQDIKPLSASGYQRISSRVLELLQSEDMQIVEAAVEASKDQVLGLVNTTEGKPVVLAAITKYNKANYTSPDRYKKFIVDVDDKGRVLIGWERASVR